MSFLIDISWEGDSVHSTSEVSIALSAVGKESTYTIVTQEFSSGVSPLENFSIKTVVRIKTYPQVILALLFLTAQTGNKYVD